MRTTSPWFQYRGSMGTPPPAMGAQIGTAGVPGVVDPTTSTRFSGRLGTAANNTDWYMQQERDLLSNPASFKGTPAYQFTRDQALDALTRQNSTIRGSGNAMAALLDRASGLASQDYTGYMSQLGQLGGQAQNYELGLGQNDNSATRNANDLTLGEGQNANTATRNENDLALGHEANANTRQSADQNFGLGMYRAGNDLQLGEEANANTAQNNWWNYDLGRGRNATDQYNAETGRGSAQSNAYLGDQANQRAWYSVYPRRVIAGGY